MYEVQFHEPNELTDGEATTLLVTDYDDFGSMYSFELADGRTRSMGKQLVDSITEHEE
jgi:hypothetical protein